MVVFGCLQSLKCLGQPHQIRVSCKGYHQSLVLSALVLYQHRRNPELALQIGEQYSWSGWYLIILWGIYATGLLMIVAFALKLGLLWLRGRSVAA